MEIDFEAIIQETMASQDKDELRVLLPLVAEKQPKIIVEIGTWRGYSAELWYKAFNPDLLVTIESDQASLNFVTKRIKDGEFAYMTPSPIIGISGNSNSTKTLANVLSVLKGRLIDFLFIDGDHTYDAVKKDFKLYSPFVKRYGIIAFHDAMIKNNEGVEVHKFWDEIAASHNPTQTKLITSIYGTGTGVLFL